MSAVTTRHVRRPHRVVHHHPKVSKSRTKWWSRWDFPTWRAECECGWGAWKFTWPAAFAAAVYHAGNTP